MSERIVVGTRGSKLALAQTERVINSLVKEGYEVEVKIIKSSGDIMKDKPLYEFKGSGAFVRSLEHALAKRHIDLAVHSYKDIPSKMLEGITVSAVLKRDSANDAFISRDKKSLDEIEKNAVIGTSSLRRRAQLNLYRNDLRFENIRGNVDTRIRKLKEGMYDAIVLAEAGIIRLGLDIDYQRLPIETFVPSANQGIIAVQTRKGEEELASFLNHEETWIEAEVERAVMRELGIGCAIPAGIYAECKRNVRLIVQIIKGGREIRVDEKLSRSDPIKEAKEIARNLKEHI